MIEISSRNIVTYRESGYVVEARGDQLEDSYDGMIPIQCRYFRPELGLVVLEFAPTRQLIECSKMSYNIPLPWQVYVCDIYTPQVWFFCRPSQLRSLDDDVFYPHISNVYRTCQPCGGVREPMPRTIKDPMQKAFWLANYFWMTGFQGGFYLAAGGHGVGAGRAGDPGGSLLPAEVGKKFPLSTKSELTMTSMYFGGDPRRERIASNKYYDWLETQEPADLLRWQWTKAGSLRSFLRQSTPNFYQRLQRKVWDRGTRQAVRVSA